MSGYGFAMGYVGSLITLLITYPLYAGGFSRLNLHNVQLSFLVSAGMFGFFALPLFLFSSRPAENRQSPFQFYPHRFPAIERYIPGIPEVSQYGKIPSGIFRLYRRGQYDYYFFFTLCTHNPSFYHCGNSNLFCDDSNLGNDRRRSLRHSIRSYRP